MWGRIASLGIYAQEALIQQLHLHSKSATNVTQAIIARKALPIKNAVLSACTRMKLEAHPARTAPVGNIVSAKARPQPSLVSPAFTVLEAHKSRLLVHEAPIRPIRETLLSKIARPALQDATAATQGSPLPIAGAKPAISACKGRSQRPLPKRNIR